MNLDRTKEFGTVTGHAQASFEQGGILFDSEGCVLSKERKADVKNVDAQRDIGAESAESFLFNVLNGGPMSRDNIIKEAENYSQNWDAVKTAANKMNIRRYPQGKSQMWKLVDA